MPLPQTPQNILVAPDSFKGTLSSAEVCAIVREAAAAVLPGARVRCLPVADGGEGSVDCFLAAAGGVKKELTVTGPLFRPVRGFYGVLPNGTAVIEMAAAAGLPLTGDAPSAADTTTYGVGELIADALGGGCRSLLLCLGGSATNDGGCGMAAALGVRFFSHGKPFIPTGRTLSDIEKIDPSGAVSRLSGVRFTVLCDVRNPLCGENGAARVFAPQKGATAEEVVLLDRGLFHLAARIKADLGTDVLNLPGAGAAGGMGGGAVAFLGAHLTPGIEAVLDAVRFDDLLQTADLVVTGEGRIDGQSAGGKVVSGVLARAKMAGVPTVALAGALGKGAERLFGMGLCGMFATGRAGAPFDEIKKTAREDLLRAAAAMFRTLTSR